MIKAHSIVTPLTFYHLSLCQDLQLTSSPAPPHLRAWSLDAHLLLVPRPLQQDQHLHNAHHHPLVKYHPPLFLYKIKNKYNLKP